MEKGLWEGLWEGRLTGSGTQQNPAPAPPVPVCLWDRPRQAAICGHSGRRHARTRPGTESPGLGSPPPIPGVVPAPPAQRLPRPGGCQGLRYCPGTVCPGGQGARAHGVTLLPLIHIHRPERRPAAHPPHGSYEGRGGEGIKKLYTQESTFS